MGSTVAQLDSRYIGFLDSRLINGGQSMPRQSLLFELQLMVPFVEFRLSSLSTSLCAKRPKLSAIPIAAKAFRINAEKRQ
jgi:hypothetical protein